MKLDESVAMATLFAQAMTNAVGINLLISLKIFLKE